MKKHSTLVFLFFLLFQLQVTLVNAAPCDPAAITASPSDVSGCIGDPISYSVSATGTTLTYQWQQNTGSGFTNIFDGSGYSNTQTSTLSFTMHAGMAGTTYRCVVTAACGSPATSGFATLYSGQDPVVNAHPDNTMGCMGGNASFAVSAVASNISYQWQASLGGSYTNISEGSVYQNVRTNTLNIVGIPGGISGTMYRCVVTGCGSSVNSNSATLDVQNCTGVNHNADNDADFIFYPNPANDVIHLSYTNTEFPEKIIIFNMQGEEVFTLGQSKDIPVSQLSSGLYTLEVIFKEHVVTRKFRKE